MHPINSAKVFREPRGRRPKCKMAPFLEGPLVPDTPHLLRFFEKRAFEAYAETGEAECASWFASEHSAERNIMLT